MRFSTRTVPDEPNAIAVAEGIALRAGASLRKLNDSNPTHHGLGPKMLGHGYDADPRGPRDAREALASFLSARGRHVGENRALPGARSHLGTAVSGELMESSAPEVSPERIYVLSSTSQAYSWLMKLLCDAGDAVLVPKPGYPLIESIARLECVDALSYPLHYDGSWTIDTAAIREALRRDTQGHIRALVLINPNNPTASYVGAHERDTILSLCKKYDVALIADEVFFDYAFDDDSDRPGHEGEGSATRCESSTVAGEGPQHRRFAGESSVLTFALDGFSKLLAAPHAKVGWIQVSGPEDEVHQALRRLDAIADDYLPMSSIIADAIPALIALADTQLAHVRSRVSTNLAVLRRLLDQDENGLVSLLRAEGGWNVLLRFPAVIDENELVLGLIHDHGVSAQPGYFFDMESNGYLALSLLPEGEEFERNVRDVLAEVQTLIDR